MTETIPAVFYIFSGLSAILCLALGYVAARFRAQTAMAELQQNLATAEATAQNIHETLTQTQQNFTEEKAAFQQERTSLNERHATAQAEIATLMAQKATETASLEQRVREISSIKEDLEKNLKTLNDAALKSSQEHFLSLAKQLFQQERDLSKSELAKAREAVDHQLKPVKETLQSYQNRLSAFEKNSAEGLQRVSTEIQQVAQLHSSIREETAKLSMALRASPKTRGRWGEHQLQNVLEMAGMAEHTDFHMEQSYDTEDGRKHRPDAIIHMPGGRNLIVDVKTSLSAYMDAVNATDEVRKDAFLNKHAQELRSHMRQLASKSYWQSVDDTTDMVVMFIAGDNFYSAAVERDPDLFQDALHKHVLMVTPTTMFAVAKSIAFSWSQAAVGEEAKHIAETGQKLYDRLSVTIDHGMKLGKSLNSSVNSFNNFVGSLERSTLPAARELANYKGISDAKKIPTLDTLETQTRPFSSKEAAALKEPIAQIEQIDAPTDQTTDQTE